MNYVRIDCPNEGQVDPKSSLAEISKTLKTLQKHIQSCW